MSIKSADLIVLGESLLAQAGGAGRPTEIVLRRATSCAYYALFHELTYRTALHMLGGPKADQSAISSIRRKLGHSDIKDVTSAIRDGKRGGLSIADELFVACAPNPDLRLSCGIFCDLQEARHSADYDHEFSFSLAASRDHIQSSREAVEYFGKTMTNPCAGAFFTALAMATV